MRQCPECRRIYNDETLNFCLDDGVELLYGPASNEPPTAILSESEAFAAGASEANTRHLQPKPVTADSTLRPRIIAVLGAVLLTFLALGSYWYYGRPSSMQVNSIAVMPFVNESENADIEYLSDGMSETLINSLTQLPNLNVKPRSSAFRYKGRESEAKAIGSELGVGAILNGRLTQRGDDITLFLTLIDTASENQIWGKQYQRKLANLVSLQTEIVRDVSESLRTRLTGVGEQRAQKNYSTNPEAYRLYLQGRYHWNKRSRRDMELAIDYFRQSAARDPKFAPAFAGLADSLSVIGGYTGTPAHASIAEARAAANSALAVDSESAEAHTALGTIFFYYDHSFQEAETEFRRALELNPESADAHHMLGLFLTCVGRPEEGLGEYRRALELEPVSLPFNRGYALALTYSRRYDESVAQFRKTIDLEPSFALAYFGLAYTLSLQQQYAEGARTYAKGLEVSGRVDTAQSLLRSFSDGGWNAFLRAQLDRRRVPGATPTPHFIRGLYFIQLGEKQAALDELNQSYDDREGFMMLLNVHPGLDPLREDPRFKDLVRRVGVPIGA